MTFEDAAPNMIVGSTWVLAPEEGNVHGKQSFERLQK
jgi:hypothetical protein